MLAIAVAGAHRQPRRGQARLQRLADPRGLASAEADALIARLPVVMWLMHAVHGNEISSSDAALAEAYHLLAARGDAAVDLILRESIVLIDPLENPDGRARFVFQNLQGEAAVPDAEPASAEHDEPWPGGRSNHYLFDMNRDWFAQSQPETRGRTKVFLDWFPQVVVDLHEMGGNSTYYFAPPADPLNPLHHQGAAGLVRHLRPRQRATLRRARLQLLHSRGLRLVLSGLRRVVADLPRRRRHDLRAGLGARPALPARRWRACSPIATASCTTSPRRSRRPRPRRSNRDQAAARLPRVSGAARCRKARQGAVREYLLPPGGDPSRARAPRAAARAAGLRGAARRRADQGRRRGTLPAGTFLVPAAQPAGRLLRNLLDTHVPQPEAFVKEQERRRKKRLGEQIYDVTAWSLPLVFDVEVVTADRATAAKSTPVARRRSAVDADGRAERGRPPPAPLPAARGRVRAAVGLGDGRRRRRSAARGDSRCAPRTCRSR